MTAGADAPDERAPRHRRRRTLLLVLVLSLLALAGLLRWASRPEQVAHLVLDRAGEALGLEISAGGVAEYRLRGMPTIVLRDVVARQPGASVPVLRARRILLSLPWTTLRSRGRDLVVHRVELDAPVLELGALQRWLSTRPDTGAARVPRLTDGFVVRDGRLVAAGWSIEDIDLDVPRLAPDLPVRAHATGRIEAGATRVPFDVRGSLARPREGAGLGIAGTVTVLRQEWRLPMELVLAGRPSFDAGARLDGLRLGARAVYESGGRRMPFVFGVAGRATFRDGLLIEPAGIALRQGRELPELQASGTIRWADTLSFDVRGRMARWPARWPTLPAPIGRPPGPLPMRLAYAGPLDFSGTTALELVDRRNTFDGRFRLPELLAWLDAPPASTPIPPITGRVSTPRLEIPGATLEGVEIETRP